VSFFFFFFFFSLNDYFFFFLFLFFRRFFPHQMLAARLGRSGGKVSGVHGSLGLVCHQTLEHARRAAIKRNGRLNALLRNFQLGGGNHFHGRGDFFNGFDDVDAALEFLNRRVAHTGGRCGVAKNRTVQSKRKERKKRK
jgi:hypothetical protein